LFEADSAGADALGEMGACAVDFGVVFWVGLSVRVRLGARLAVVGVAARTEGSVARWFRSGASEDTAREGSDG
jgi:hypothetical protein